MDADQSGTNGTGFYIGTSASDQKLVINTSGSIGIGTTSPTSKLSVSGDVAFAGLTGATGAGSLCLSSSNKVVYNSGSDACLPSLRDTKHNIEKLDLAALDIVNALYPVSFVYNEGDGRTRYGFIAEYTADVDVLLATYDAEGNISGIDDRSLIAVVIAGMQELWTRLEEIITRIERLEEQNQSILDQNRQLEDRIRELESAQGISSPRPTPEVDPGHEMESVDNPLPEIDTEPESTDEIIPTDDSIPEPEQQPEEQSEPLPELTTS